MTTYQTAQEAIDSSDHHNQIMYCEDTAENRAYLEAESSDYVDLGEVIEYWADDEEDENDMEWRVHIRTCE